MSPSPDHDVLIIGGGPAGATAGLILARAGLRAVVLEKSAFPRFHIGESFLPRGFAFLRELGLERAVKALPHVPKFGAAFAMADDDPDRISRFEFNQSLTPGGETLNIERAAFDAMMLREASAAGAEVRENEPVREILELIDGRVRVRTDAGELTGRYLFDASGQGTVVGRHLGTRVPAPEPHLRKVAYFGHFDNVRRLPGREDGHPLIVLADEGWFWVIPLDERKTSVGLVMDPAVAKATGVPASRMLAWGLARSPLMRERMADATGDETNHVGADFSYRCRPYAGPGYFLLGDAAAFVDPIFSTGVCLGMMSAAKAAEQVQAVLSGGKRPAAARRAYVRYVENSTGVFFKLIRRYYEHSFRELFLNGTGPMSVHRAVLSVLAGHVFPRPAWSLRWRLHLFFACVTAQKWVALCPRRRPFSLLADGGGAAAIATGSVAAGAGVE